MRQIPILEFRLGFEGKVHGRHRIAILSAKPVYTFLIPQMIFEFFSRAERGPAGIDSAWNLNVPKRRDFGTNDPERKLSWENDGYLANGMKRLSTCSPRLLIHVQGFIWNESRKQPERLSRSRRYESKAEKVQIPSLESAPRTANRKMR